jgi:septal ring factor EnvC (AmiA/AmiB activator)
MEVNLDQLRKDLAALEAEETHVSAERRHLQRQIDFGFATQTTRAREREVSDRRRQLHRRIDELRELLNMPSGPQQAPTEPRLEPNTGHGSSGLERIGDR